MSNLDRRTFIEVSTAALVAASSKQILSQVIPPRISADDRSVHVNCARYSWSYSRHNDTFRLMDAEGRLIVTGSLQPAVVVASSTNPLGRRCSLGRALPPKVDAGRVTFDYEAVNGDGHISVTVLFEDRGFRIEPVVYESAAADDVVSLHYFTNVNKDVRTPSLDASYFVVPGIDESSSISPIEGQGVRLDQTVWLGHGGFIPNFPQQQWALPVDYFCGFSVHSPGEGLRNAYSQGISEAFVCGLADLPNGDLLLDLHDGRSSMWIDYRSDLWKHLRGPGKLILGATLCWALGKDAYDAIAQYYVRLLDAKIVQRKKDSAEKIVTALSPEFCTWGSQVDRGGGGIRLDQAFLNEIYKELKGSGMGAKLFSIDDKWEGHYGTLEHSAERLPQFEQFLDRLRTDGYRIGLWTALMRCEQPSELGLSLDNMLKQPDGRPIKGGGGAYYFFDLTQPEVGKVVADRARLFVRRYKPDLVKFDFGYELPAIRYAAPSDMRWAGERLLAKSLDAVLPAMREENPDIVVMYYQLSPLFVKYFDLHGIDDLFLAAGEYDVEANRRIYFSSLLGLLGVPTYGSSGYDWSSAPNIWFDSAAVGTIGSLNDFRGDEMGESATPASIAKYNGLTHALRGGNVFSIIPFPPAQGPEAPTRGAHSRSWARLENGEVVLIAMRPVPPYDNDRIVGQPLDPKVAGLVETTSPVVVASQTADGIAQCERLVVVPYGEGKTSIRWRRGLHAEVVTHYFGGSTSRAQEQVQNGLLTLAIHERGVSGLPVEWMEISISS